MSKKISKVLASERDYKVRPFALVDHEHEFYPNTVADIAERDAITAPLRYEGSIVYVKADQTTYQLRGGSANADWVTLVDNLGATSHTTLADIGTNTHVQIDAHIADSTLHFTQASISITESQISDLQSYALATHNHDATYLGINDSAVSADALATTGASVDVSAAAPPVAGQVLTAVSATTATWQNATAAGIGDIVQTGSPAATHIGYFTADKNLSGDSGLTWTTASALLSVIAAASPEIRIQDSGNPGTTMTASLSFWDSAGIAAEIRMDGTGDLRIENADGEIRFDTGTSDVVVSGNGDLSVGNDLSIIGYISGYGGTPADGSTLQWVTANGRAEFTLGAVMASGTPADNQIATFNAANTIEGDANFLWTGAVFTAAGLVWDSVVDQLTLGGADLATPGIEIDGSLTSTPFINFAQNSVVKAIIRYSNTNTALEISSSEDDIRLRPGNVDTVLVTQAQLTAGTYLLDIDQVLGVGQDNYVLTYDNTGGQISLEAIPFPAEVNDLSVAVTWANVPDANITVGSVTQHVASIDHDALLNFTATEHFTQAAISIPLSQISDITALAAEVNLLDLAGLTAGWVLSADTATTASWKAPPSGGANQLSDLTDVNTSTPTNRFVLVADGIDFESRLLVEADISDLGSYSVTSHTHLLAAGATDVTATAAEVNLLDLAGLTVGWVLSADSATTASWKAPTGGGSIGGSITDNQIAVGATTADDIEGDAALTFNNSINLFTVGDSGLTQPEISISGPASSIGKLTWRIAGVEEAIIRYRDSSSELEFEFTGSAYAMYMSATEVRANQVFKTVASVAGTAGFNVPHGTAPTVPVNGDIWTTTAGMFARVNGATVDLTAGGAIGGSITDNQIAVGATTADDIEGSANLTYDGTSLNVDSGRIDINGTLAQIRLEESDAAAEEKNWMLLANGGTLIWHMYNDGYTLEDKWLVVDRTGRAHNTTTLYTNGDVPAFVLSDGQLVLDGRLTPPASTASRASMRIAHGTAPTVPVNGDLWTTTAGMFLHTNGTTVGPFIEAGAGGIGGSITDNQVAVGATTADDIEGDTGLTYTKGTQPILRLSGTNGPQFDMSGGQPQFRMEESDQTLDQKNWMRLPSAGALYNQIYDDAYVNAYTWMQVERSGTGASVQVDTIDFTAVTDVTINSALVVTGAFTSLGIDDNATGERVEISDSVLQLGGTVTYALTRNVNDQLFRIAGGSGSGQGAEILMYGETHATQAQDMLFRASDVTWMQWDESQGTLEIKTGTGAKTTAVTLNSSQLATWGSGANDFGHARGGSTSAMWLSGGTAQNSGAALTLNGPTTVGVGNDWGLSSGGTDNLYWDNSASTLTTTGTIYAPGLISPNAGGYFNIQNAAGNDTFPTYAFQDDGNTGMLKPSADALGFTTGGTRALTISSAQLATFAGNITVSHASQPAISITDTTTPVTLELISTDSVGIVGTDTAHDLVLRTNNTTTLTLAGGSRLATFAGDVEIANSGSASLIINGGATSDPFLQFEQNGTFKAYTQYLNTGSELRTVDVSGPITFYPANALALTLAASGNVTVGNGDLYIQNAASPAMFIIDDTNSVTFRAISTDTDARIGTTSNHDLDILTNSTSALTINSNQAVQIGNTLCVGEQVAAGAILEVRDNGGSKSPLLGVRADDGSPWHFAIQNELYHSALTTGMRFQVGSAGASSIYAADDGTTPGSLILRTDAVAAVTIGGSDQAVTVHGELKIEAYSEDADEYTATTGTRTLDTSLATYFYGSADMGTAVITFAFSNPVATGRVTSIMVEMLGADGATLTWPAGVDWPGGTEPTWTAGVDIAAFWTRDGGTTWHGSAVTLDSK